MVSLIDGLEDRGLVERRRSPRDRRKDILGLTAAGEGCLRRGEEARREAERRFLAPLTEAEAATLRRALRRLVAEDQGGDE